jgi:hypothetical protein
MDPLSYLFDDPIKISPLVIVVIILLDNYLSFDPYFYSARN